MKFRKVIAYTALHYGREFLPWAIRSIIDDVEEYHVLYSPVGSHSVRTDVPCPETRDELFRIAHTEAGDKLRWTDGDWRFEGQQRDTIYRLTDADVIVTLDADEVWSPGLLRAILKYGEHATVSDLRVPFWHYWRSLKRVIKHDPAFPVRVRFLPLQKGVTTFQRAPWNTDSFRIHHFGYAISPALMQYKWKIHGHINELRKDCDWFNDVYMANRQFDCHPVGSEWWNPEVCDVPEFLRDHPYANLEVIP
jgi:hypothetical protein